MIDRPNFYTNIREYFGPLKQTQVDGINAILDEWEASGLTDIRWLAYMLATAWHETARTMQPIKEFGGNKYFIKRYWENVKIRKELGNLSPQDAVAFCGKGLVQITGRRNYTKMGKILGIPLALHPDMAMDMKVSVKIMFEGMTMGKSFGGDFTGKHLGNYFNLKTEDWFNARRIINGTDKASKIAGEAKVFYEALQ